MSERSRLMAPPVVMLHGALRSTLGLWPTRAYLARRGIAARAFGYHTRIHNLDRHVERLQAFLDRSYPPAVRQSRPLASIGFLTHSMGALVVRAYLHTVHGRALADRVSIAMLAPPNRGSQLAASWASAAGQRATLYRRVYGEAADLLLPQSVRNLPQPPVDARCLILVGGRGPGSRGYNAALSGDDDGVVATNEVGLPGVPVEFVGGVHSLMQWNPAALRRAAEFFCSAE